MQGFRFGSDPYGFLDTCAKRFGGAFTMRFPRDPPRVVVSDPAHVRQIFALKPDAYAAGALQVAVNLGSRSLLFLDGEDHRRDRQLMMPSLHGDRLRSYARTMFDVTNLHLDRLAPGARVDMKAAFHDITFDVLTTCLFGGSEPRRAEVLRACLGEWISRVFRPEVFLGGMMIGPRKLRAILDDATQKRGASSWKVLERAPWNVAGRAKGEAMRILREEVEACQQGRDGGRTDVLATIAMAKYDDGSPIAVDHAVDELVTLLVGGHETTASSLAWALCHLLQRPEVWTRLEQEIAAAFPDGRVDPTRASELKLLEACINETMRLTPIAPAVNRNLTRSLTLGPWTIPAGGIVFPSTYVTHHRDDLWDEPRAFRPERFLKGGGVPPDQFFPFGGGRRTCIGMAFAMFEMRIVLVALLSRVKLRRESKAMLPKLNALTTVPRECDAVVDAVRPRVA